MTKHEALPLPDWWKPGSRTRVKRWFVSADGRIWNGPTGCPAETMKFSRWESATGWVRRSSDPKFDWTEITQSEAMNAIHEQETA